MISSGRAVFVNMHKEDGFWNRRKFVIDALPERTIYTEQFENFASNNVVNNSILVIDFRCQVN